MIFIFVLFLFFSCVVGWAFVRRLSDSLPWLLSAIGALLLGIGICVPIAYVLSCIFTETGAPILWGTTGTTVLAAVIYFFVIPKAKVIKIGRSIKGSEILILICALLFSTWMMVKTFHGNSSGEVFVGSNNIFDFGLAIGLMRSMSWGANIPVMSPFFAGMPLFYHFFFNFWTAMWEYFGVPLIWAINIPSILSFAALLVVIYYIPQIIAKQKPITGWIAVFLTITNSSLTFWKLLPHIKTLWRLPTYPFAGPFDGSTISIYMTLNNYVNQRHLAFALALGFFLLIIFIQKIQTNRLTDKFVVIVGAITGLLLMWNMLVFIVIGVSLFLTLILYKKWKELFIYGEIAAITGCVFLSPYFGLLTNVVLLLRALTGGSASSSIPTWNIISYLWQNLGLLPVVCVIGYFGLAKKFRIIFWPFILLFMLECAYATLDKRGFEQKSLSFIIIGLNILASIGLVWLWEKKICS